MTSDLGRHRSIEVIESGTQIGRYEMMRPLAIGGMAQVYLAKATGIEQFEKLVVFKRILPGLSNDPQFVSMFLDEARLAASLQHPNIAQVYDIGCADGDYFFVMEYVDGKDVGRIRRQAATMKLDLPISHALRIVMETARALHSAHERCASDGTPLNIVHRDVTPSNILVTYEGCIKLIDFGIAKATGRKTETKTGIRKGKTSHMSPEQCVGDPIDRRSDIFTLGILLFELTTGTRLFKADSEYETMQRIVRGRTPLPSDRKNDYPQALESIVLRALERDPDDRYQTAKQLYCDLDNFVQQHGLHVSQYDMATYLQKLFQGDQRVVQEQPQSRPNPSPNESGQRRTNTTKALEPKPQPVLRRFASQAEPEQDSNMTTPGFNRKVAESEGAWSTLRDMNVDALLDATQPEDAAGDPTDIGGPSTARPATDTDGGPTQLTETTETDRSAPEDMTEPGSSSTPAYAGMVKTSEAIDVHAKNFAGDFAEEPSGNTDPNKRTQEIFKPKQAEGDEQTEDVSNVPVGIAANSRAERTEQIAEEGRLPLPLRAPAEGGEPFEPTAHSGRRLTLPIIIVVVLALAAIGAWRLWPMIQNQVL